MLRIPPHMRITKANDGDYYRDLSGTIWRAFSTINPLPCDYAPCGQPCTQGFIMQYAPKRVMCAHHFQVHLHDGRRA